MKNKKFRPDFSVGMLDLVFLLLTLFFILTVISVQSPSLADNVATNQGNEERSPVVLSLSGQGYNKIDPPEISLVSSGNLDSPVAGDSILYWLSQICSTKPAVVQVNCPENVTHLTCKRMLFYIRKNAPSCNYQY